MNKFSKLLIAVVSISVICGFVIYFYPKMDFRSSVNRKTQSADSDIVSKVGKIINLPDGEIPTIATVSNLEKLKNQEFFAKAKVGDKVLIYAKAKKAFLYDPVANVVLDVAPIH